MYHRLSQSIYWWKCVYFSKFLRRRNWIRGKSLVNIWIESITESLEGQTAVSKLQIICLIAWPHGLTEGALRKIYCPRTHLRRCKCFGGQDGRISQNVAKTRRRLNPSPRTFLWNWRRRDNPFRRMVNLWGHQLRWSEKICLLWLVKCGTSTVYQ